MKNNAKKALKNERKYKSSGKNGITRFKQLIDEKKTIIQEEKENSKREYNNINDDLFYPLTLASKYVPVKSLDNGIIETRNKRFLKIIELEPAKFELKSEEEQLSIVKKFGDYLTISPIKFQIKCLTQRPQIDEFLKKKYNNLKKETVKKCKRLHDDNINYTRTIANNELVSRRYFIIFEYCPPVKVQQHNRQLAQETLEQNVNDAINYLSSCGVEIIPEGENKKNNQGKLLYEILNREEAIDIPFGINITSVFNQYKEKNNISQISEVPVSEYISPKKISFSNSKYVVVNDTYYSFLWIASNGLHEKVPIAWTSLLTSLGSGIDLDIFIKKENRSEVLSKMQRKVRISDLRYNDMINKQNSDQKDALSNVISSGTYIENRLRNDGKENFFYTNLMITITASNEKDILWRKNEVEKFLKLKGFEYVDCTYRQEDCYNSYMPFNYIEKSIFNDTKQNITTYDLEAYFPFTSYELDDSNGTIIGRTDNDSMASIDKFNRKQYSNANIIIQGSSGFGKTFLINVLALGDRLKHIPTYIIAPVKGEDYYNVCKAVGGSFIQFAPSSSDCINIMDIYVSKIKNNFVNKTSLLSEQIQELIIAFSLLIPNMTRQEINVLDFAAQKCYNEFGITKDNNSLYDANGKIKDFPTLQDLYNHVPEEITRLKECLVYLCFGSANAFNNKTNIDEYNEYQVFDISKLKGDLLRFGMFICIKYLNAKGKLNKEQPKSVYIDEIWNLIGVEATEQSAKYVSELWKTFRGYNGSVCGATQEISDYYSLKNGYYGKAILNNSTLKFVLHLENEEADTANKYLNLTDEEISIIKNLERGTTLFIANNKKMKISIETSNLVTKLISQKKLLK